MTNGNATVASCGVDETPSPGTGVRHLSDRYTIFDSGSARDWAQNSIELGGLGKVPGKLFLKNQLGFTSCEMSINAMPPGGGMPFLHTHEENEEVYVFLGGVGQMQIDGVTFPVTDGTIMRVAPAAERTWRNTGHTPLVYIVSQMRDGSLRQYGATDGKVPDKPVVWPKP